MRYEKINGDLARSGMEEVLKISTNNFESAVNGNRNLGVGTMVKEYFQASRVANGVGVDTTLYDDVLISRTKELKRRFGVEVK